MICEEDKMRPRVDKSWRKRSPAYHKSIGEKRIEDKERKELNKQLQELEKERNKNEV